MNPSSIALSVQDSEAYVIKMRREIVTLWLLQQATLVAVVSVVVWTCV